MGIASTRVSSGAWSKPSPTSLPVESSTRGASAGSASSSLKQRRPLLRRHTAVQHEQRWTPAAQCLREWRPGAPSARSGPDLAALREGATDLVGNRGRARGIPGDVPETSWIRASSAAESALSGIAGRSPKSAAPRGFAAGVPDRPALHEDDRVVAVAADRRRRQAQDVSAPWPASGSPRTKLRREVVALIDDDVAVVRDQRRRPRPCATRDWMTATSICPVGLALPPPIVRSDFAGRPETSTAAPATGRAAPCDGRGPAC